MARQHHEAAARAKTRIAAAETHDGDNTAVTPVKPAPPSKQSSRFSFNIMLNAAFYRAACNAGGHSHGKAVCLSICLSHACFVTKRTKVVPTFLYRM